MKKLIAALIASMFAIGGFATDASAAPMKSHHHAKKAGKKAHHKAAKKAPAATMAPAASK